MPNLPLLDYSFSTTPHPLQISTPGTIVVVASNPGGYSDRPDQEYVAVESIVFDFGVKGSDGGNLTTIDGLSWRVISPPGWDAPTVTGLVFTFVPPTGREKIFPAAGLQFSFVQVPINATVGTVMTTITERASSPGDPAQPDYYPPLPLQARTKVKPLGKFPVDFSVGDLIATPADVPAGGSTTLSWTGSPGATYEITHGSNRITKHGNGALLQPNDLFPNSAAGDAPLVLRNRTTFTLTVTYTPPGGSDPAIFQRQVSVSIYFPNPVIDLFSLTPTFVQVTAPNPAVITLSWEVKNGRKPDCVAFTVTPPLPTFPATGKGLKHEITHSQLITLTAYGDEGTTPASDSRYVVIGRTTRITDAMGSAARHVAVSPDGAYAIVEAESSHSITVVATSGADIMQWKTVAQLAGFPPNPQGVAVSASSFGKFVLIAAPNDKGGQLSVLTMTGATPYQWPVVHLTAGFGLNAVHVSATPDGKYIFVSCGGPHSFPGPKSCVSILTVNNSDPKQWPVFNISSDDQQSLIRNTRVSPRGDYAFITVVSNGEFFTDRLWVVALNGPNPAQWPIVAKLGLNSGKNTRGITVSPDGKLGLVANFRGQKVEVLDLSSSKPEEWRVSGIIGNGMPSPVEAAFSADGAYAFVPNVNHNVVTILGISHEPPAKWGQFQLTENIGPRPYSVATAKQGAVAFITNDDYKASSLTVVALAESTTLQKTPAPQPPWVTPRRVVRGDGAEPTPP